MKLIFVPQHETKMRGIADDHEQHAELALDLAHPAKLSRSNTSLLPPM